MCALCALGFLLGVFFGFGGLFFDPLRVFVLNGGPESDGATAAGKGTRGSNSKRAQRIKGLFDRTAPDMAMEEIPDLCSGEAVFRSLKSLEDAIGDGVSGAGAEERGGVGTVVPGREVCLGKQLFLWLFYLRESRRLGPDYAYLQVSYCHSPPLRLLVSDAGSIEDERFHGGTIRQGALLACIATLRPGALHAMWVSGRSGTLGLDARRCSPLRQFFQARANCLDRCGLLEKV